MFTRTLITKKVNGADSDLQRVLRRHHTSPFGGIPIPSLLSKFGVLPMEGDKHTPHLCLVRSIDLSVWSTPHIAISAITGQLSDMHDILKLETKYIRKEHLIKDDALPIQGSKRRVRFIVLWRIYWSIICMLSFLLIFETALEMKMISNIYSKQSNIGQTIDSMNPWLIASYLITFVQYLMLIFAFNWKCLLCNGFLVVIRLQKFMTNDIVLTTYGFEMKKFFLGTNYKQWLRIQLISLCFSAFYHGWRLFHI